MFSSSSRRRLLESLIPMRRVCGPGETQQGSFGENKSAKLECMKVYIYARDDRMISHLITEVIFSNREKKKLKMFWASLCAWNLLSLSLDFLTFNFSRLYHFAKCWCCWLHCPGCFIHFQLSAELFHEIIRSRMNMHKILFSVQFCSSVAKL